MERVGRVDVRAQPEAIFLRRIDFFTRLDIGNPAIILNHVTREANIGDVPNRAVDHHIGALLVEAAIAETDRSFKMINGQVGAYQNCARRAVMTEQGALRTLYRLNGANVEKSQVQALSPRNQDIVEIDIDRRIAE